WRETPMRFVDNDRWAGTFSLERIGRHVFTIEAMPHPFRSWLTDLDKRVAADQDVTSELLEGAALVRDSLPRARGEDARLLRGAARALETPADRKAAVAGAREPALAEAMDRALDRADATPVGRDFEVVVDRERARFAAWYEFFPRSTARGRYATFA